MSFGIAFVLFKQETAYEMSISDWSSDVCSSDLCSSHNSSANCRTNHGSSNTRANGSTSTNPSAHTSTRTKPSTHTSPTTNPRTHRYEERRVGNVRASTVSTGRTPTPYKNKKQTSDQITSSTVQKDTNKTE